MPYLPPRASGQDLRQLTAKSSPPNSPKLDASTAQVRPSQQSNTEFRGSQDVICLQGDNWEYLKATFEKASGGAFPTCPNEAFLDDSAVLKRSLSDLVKGSDADILSGFWRGGKDAFVAVVNWDCRLILK